MRLLPQVAGCSFGAGYSRPLITGGKAFTTFQDRGLKLLGHPSIVPITGVSMFFGAPDAGGHFHRTSLVRGAKTCHPRRIVARYICRNATVSRQIGPA